MNIEQVLRWLDRVGEDATLVGGQAVALWEHVLGLPITTETVDIDFLGDAAQARGLAEALGYRCRIPDPEEPTPNTAILIDGAGVVVADFRSRGRRPLATPGPRRRFRALSGVTRCVSARKA